MRGEGKVNRGDGHALIGKRKRAALRDRDRGPDDAFYNEVTQLDLRRNDGATPKGDCLSGDKRNETKAHAGGKTDENTQYIRWEGKRSGSAGRMAGKMGEGFVHKITRRGKMQDALGS